MTTLKIKKLHPDAIMPAYATDGAACFDLHAVDSDNAPRVLGMRGGAATIRTGLAVEIPHGFVMLVFSRSGHGFNRNIRLANCVGVIDSDYRGEIMVRLTADGSHDMAVQDGDRIAQAMLVPIPQVSFDLVDELGDTARGAGGLGSTGK